MTSYQQRKQEIRELEKRVYMLEEKLMQSGIEFGQQIIDDKIPHVPKEERHNPDRVLPHPPTKPLARKILHPPIHPICKKCGSSMPRSGWLGLFGKRYCINSKCINSRS